MNKIYVVTHKDFDDSILDEHYQVIKVGSLLNNIEVEEKGWISDDNGDNIADLNPFYCELTAMYYIWKNINLSDEDVVGLVHYRRLFFYNRKESITWTNNILNDKDLNNIMEKYKAILPYERKKKKGYSRLYYNSKKNTDEELNCLQGIIEEYYPEYINSFRKVMYGTKSTWGNMFVMRKKDFNEYCEWLFNYLSIFDEKIKKIQNPIRPRIDGYMSEMLLPVWFNNKYKKNEIYRLEVRSTERDFPEFHSGIKGKILRFIRTHKIILDLSYWLIG